MNKAFNTKKSNLNKAFKKARKAFPHCKTLKLKNGAIILPLGRVDKKYIGMAIRIGY